MRAERGRYEESGCTIHSRLQHQLVTLEIVLCEENSYFPLPKELINPMKGSFNIQNEINEWFRCCLVRYSSPVDKNSSKIKNIDCEFAKQLDFKGAKFPVYKNDCAKTEKQNNVSISVFGLKRQITILYLYFKTNFWKACWYITFMEF